MAIYIVAWFAVVLPLLGAGASFFADTPRRAGQLCRGFVVLSFLLTLVALGTRLKNGGQAPFDSVITFFSFNPTESTLFATRLEPLFGVHVDSVSAVFAALVGFIGVAVQAYAGAALRGDAAHRRFFWASSLLIFALLGVVYSPNLFQFWALSAIASAAVYILMLHWWDRGDAAAPARRVLLSLYAADLTLLLAVVFVFVKFGIFTLQQPAPPGQDIFDPFTFSGLSTMVDAAVRHQITGVGQRTLEVVGILVIVVALVRTAQLPFHLWFTEVVQAPAAVAALACATAGIGGAFLVARELPLLQAATHALSALGLVGAASALLLGAIALFTRDIYRAGALITAALLGVSLAAFGAGGFSAGLFALAAAGLSSALYFVAAGNLVRGYRTRVIAEMGGSWSRMRTSSLALAAWAAAAGGLSLGAYYALSAAFDNRFVNGGHLGGAARGLLIVLLIAGGVVVTLSCWSIVFRVLRGEPARRRGFQPEKLADARDASRTIALALVIALVVLVVFALPGLGRVAVGKSGTIAFTWQQLLVLGPRPQAGLSLAALGVSLLELLLGIALAVLLQPILQRRATENRGPAPAVAVAAVRGAERGFRSAGAPVLLAARFVARFDERVGDTLVDTVGEGIGAAADQAQRLRRLPARAYSAGAAAAVVLLVVLSLLAASGHLGGVKL